MKTKIPSPVLARIQLMFQSGSTLDEVASALDLDTSWQQQPSPVISNPEPVKVAASAPVVQPANDIRMPRLEELGADMESHVSSLLERDDVRDIPAIAGSLDAIYQHVVAIRKEISSPTKVTQKKAVPVAQPAPVNKTVVAPKKKAISEPKKTAPKTPPPMKIPPPVKKIANEKLKPTGELPAAAKRRDVVHPFATSLSDKNAPSRPMSAPLQAEAKIQSPPGQPVHAYRDRIAMAMNQISTITDEHDREDDHIAARHS